MIDLRQASEYAKYMESIGWTIDGKPGQYAYIKKFPIIGNFIKLQRPEQLSNEAIERLSNKYKPFQFVVEPRNEYQVSSIKYLGFKQSKSYFVPSKTIKIDLTKSESQLLKEMHHKTRYNIRKITNYKLQITNSKDIKAFADFWQECALKQRGMFLSQKKEIVELYTSLKKRAHIILIKQGTETLSGILLICTKDIAYYMYAASTAEGKRLFAPTLNAWEVIKLAKKLKCKLFDFEGVYDDRFPIETWRGFTRFKKSFGGKEVEYPGTFVKFRFPLLNLFSV